MCICRNFFRNGNACAVTTNTDHIVKYARLVVVAFSGIRDELITHYRLPREKVAVIPMAAPVEVYPNPGIEKVAEVKRKFSLPASFALFPAQTYPHKNHLLLLQALDLLRSRHKLKPTVICTGSKTSFFRSIERACRQLDLDRSSSISRLRIADGVEVHIFTLPFPDIPVPLRRLGAAGDGSPPSGTPRGMFGSEGAARASRGCRPIFRSYRCRGHSECNCTTMV